MLIEPSTAQREIEDRFSELFGGEAAAAIRRMGERPLGAGTAGAGVPDEDREAREIVWRSLMELDTPRTTAHGDLAVIAELMGAALYRSPYLDTVAARELLHASADEHGPLAGRLGERDTVALAAREHGHGEPTAYAPLTLHEDGTLSGRRRFVAFAPDVDRFAVLGAVDGRPAVALVPNQGPAIRRHDDIGRGDLYAVEFDHAPVTARGPLGPGTDPDLDWQHVRAAARVRHAAYLVGAARAAIDLTVAHARERRQFGRTIGRFQDIAFRLARLTMRADAARLLTYHAAWQVDEGRDTRLDAAQTLAMASDVVRDAAAEAIQIHGAVGMTEESDAQLFYRRAAVEASWWGSPADLRVEAAPLLAERVRRQGNG